eukprot:c8293_g1_i2.p1 GENE.c8293_g1_i2~~c8293_g1_i2.p1  ORF type:complete len:175 (+),score=83.83 c8293_g1_i2:22-525(+)
MAKRSSLTSSKPAPRTTMAQKPAPVATQSRPPVAQSTAAKPPVAQSTAAKPPAVQQQQPGALQPQTQQPGLMGSMMGTMAASMAGSVVGHAISNSLFSGSGESAPQVQSGPVSPLGESNTSQNDLGPCAPFFKSYMECVRRSGTESAACMFDANQLEQCKREARLWS